MKKHNSSKFYIKKVNKTINSNGIFEKTEKLNKIKNIIKNTINNIMIKQICTCTEFIDENNIKKCEYKYLNIEQMYSGQYNEYYIPVSNDKYIILNKNEYQLFRFRIIEHNNISKFQIYNNLYDMHLNKNKTMSSKSNVNTKYESIGKKCNLRFRIVADSNIITFTAIINVNE